jgi:8-oxo-dGTP pyrophosphatase MutT (NUDIX family)
MRSLIRKILKEERDMKHAAGTLLICKNTGRFLLVKRGKGGSYPGTWATVGGSIDPGEKPLDAAERELYEETKIDPSKVKFEFFEKQDKLNNTNFYFFKGYCDEEFECKLNEENDDCGWFDMDTLPSPLIPLFKDSLDRIFS